MEDGEAAWDREVVAAASLALPAGVRSPLEATEGSSDQQDLAATSEQVSRTR